MINHNTLPIRLADGSKPRVVLTFSLIEVAVLQRPKVKRCCEVKRMICDRAALRLSRSDREASWQIRDLCEASYLSGEDVPLCWSEVLA